jgi:hypothetical protein
MVCEGPGVGCQYQQELPRRTAVNRYKATYALPSGSTATAYFSADHFSVSKEDVVAHFYRNRPAPARNTGDTGTGGSLVGAVVRPLTIELEEKSLIVVAEAADLDPWVVAEYAEHLNTDSIPDDKKLRLVISAP